MADATHCSGSFRSSSGCSSSSSAARLRTEARWPSRSVDDRCRNCRSSYVDSGSLRLLGQPGSCCYSERFSPPSDWTRCSARCSGSPSSGWVTSDSDSAGSSGLARSMCSDRHRWRVGDARVQGVVVWRLCCFNPEGGKNSVSFLFLSHDLQGLRTWSDLKIDLNRFKS